MVLCLEPQRGLLIFDLTLMNYFIEPIIAVITCIYFIRHMPYVTGICQEELQKGLLKVISCNS